jgi:UDP-sugar transporter A1/2/3
VVSANFTVEVVKFIFSAFGILNARIKDGINEDNKIWLSVAEIRAYPIPAALYLVKNLLQYHIFLYMEPPSYQILKNLNIISTGILYQIFLKKNLNALQWSALLLLSLGCAVTQLVGESDRVFATPIEGLAIAVIMAILSGAAGVYTELVMKRHPQRNINVQNLYMYLFGILFNAFALLSQDTSEHVFSGFSHGFNLLVCVMILNHAFSGIAVSMVMKYADNIVKVYATSVAMIVTTLVSVVMFQFRVTAAFFLGSSVVSIAVFLHYFSKVSFSG